jgi:hypothetical protein
MLPDGTEFADCIHCGERPALGELGYCDYCHWAIKAEFEQFFYELREHLRLAADFQRWLTDGLEAEAA